MILLDDDRQLEIDRGPWPEPSRRTVQDYYLPEPTARGTLYGSCMVCGMTQSHEHHHCDRDTPQEHEAGRIVHEVCDSCWEWYTDIEAGARRAWAAALDGGDPAP